MAPYVRSLITKMTKIKRLYLSKPVSYITQRHEAREGTTHLKKAAMGAANHSARRPESDLVHQ